MRRVTIDVDLNEALIPIAFRVPKPNELVICPDGEVLRVTSDQLVEPRLIVVRNAAAVWPAWCKAAAICRDECGILVAHERIPSRKGAVWVNGGAWTPIDPRLFDIRIPDDWDWTVPLVNPNYIGAE